MSLDAAANFLVQPLDGVDGSGRFPLRWIEAGEGPAKAWWDNPNDPSIGVLEITPIARPPALVDQGAGDGSPV